MGLLPTPSGVVEVPVENAMDCAPDIGFITNPSYLHMPFAVALAKNGLNLFIEKPLGTHLGDIDRLTDFVIQKNLSAYVAYPFRFHWGLYCVKTEYRVERLKSASIVCRTNRDKWTPYVVGTHRRESDGVLLELSHEIDICQWFFGNIEHIRGVFDDERAFLKVKCEHVPYEVAITLDLNSREEERYIAFDNDRFDYQRTDEMYDLQVCNYLSHYQRPEHFRDGFLESVNMFKKLIQFRDGGHG